MTGDNGSDCINGIVNGVKDTTTVLKNEAALHKLRGKLEEFKSVITKDVKLKVDCMIEDILKELKHNNLHQSEFNGNISEKQHEIWANRPKVNQVKGTKFPDKVFVARDSLFTCLYKVPHIKSLYHTFLVMLLVMTMNTAVQDYVTKGQINIGQNTINSGMGGFWSALCLWSVMQAVVFLVYFALKLWAEVRFTIAIRKNEFLQYIWDAMCLIVFVAFQLVFMFAGSYGALKLDLAFVSCCSLLLEMTRFVMKMHAFVRTNVPRILAGKLKIDESNDENDSVKDLNVRFPTFSMYVYYLFAPTFIYRDSYPRTSRIDWKFAFCRLLEVVGVMFFMSNIHERYIIPNFQSFGKDAISVGDLTAKLFSMILPGFLIFISGFYCVLHAWLNFTSELLRFADRMFYKDWWTASNFDTYYRTWNVVVHDWLYEFIYKDIFHYVLRRSKTASAITVFLASAAIHEYILGMAFRFFFPVMFVFFFGAGVIMTFLTRNINKTFGNFLLWLALITGNGLLVSFYAIEYNARQNCPVGNSLIDRFIPVSWSCNGLVN